MKRDQKLVGRILVIAMSATAIMAVILTIIGITEVKNAYIETYEDELKTAAIQAESELSNEWDGDWSLSNEGRLLKGEEDIHDEYLKQMQSLTSQTGIAYSLIYDNILYVSTLEDENGKSMEGTTISDTVVDIVLKQGKAYMSDKLRIGNKQWYSYYKPITNSDGKVVGMAFAGRDASSIYAGIFNTTALMVSLAVGIMLVILFAGIAMIRSSNRAIEDIEKGLIELAKGNLSFRFTDKTMARRDELGVIAENAITLRKHLTEVIKNTLSLSEQVSKSGNELSDSSETASTASNQVTNAVTDISKGAISQAESVEESMTHTNEMGENIDSITSSVEELSAAAAEMKNASDRTVHALEKLLNQNQDVMTSMEEIDAQIKATNDAVKEIANASNVISEISSQTNLLALNASIEAARAGEAGRGFAVVAAEIGTLADQSGEASVSITKIVTNLVEESKKSVDTISKLNEGFNAQNDQLNSTKGDMDGMMTNVGNVENDSKIIAEKIDKLNASKNKLNGIISDLSAISEENAAATEETNASMQELNATFEVINNSASELKELAVELNEQMNYFKM